MSHFKTFFIFVILLISKASFAMNCLQEHTKAQEICFKDTLLSAKAVETAEDEEALAALAFIRKTHLHCFQAISECKKACRFESKSSDSNDLRAFNMLLNCESGDLSRAYSEKFYDKSSAERTASERNLTKPTNNRHGRVSEAGTGLTTLPGLMPAIR